jgi:hypothetical protein
VGTLVGHLCQDFACGGGPGFEPHRLHKNFKHQNNNRVPRGSPCLGHVAPPNLPINMPRVKNHSPHVKSKLACPLSTCHITTCHMSLTPMSVVPLPRQPVRTVQSTIFLPVWQIEQNVISHSSDVRLTRLKCVGFVMMRPTHLFVLK